MSQVQDSTIVKYQADFDAFSFIMAFEGGELEEREIIEGFQHLIDSGLVWQLQGSYGRMASHLIEEGYCHG